MDLSFAVKSIDVNIYWRLQNLAQPAERWELCAGYTPLIRVDALRDLFPSEELNIQTPESIGLGRLIALVDEIRPHLPDRPSVPAGLLTLQVRGELRHIGHYPISSLEHMRPENVYWSRPNVIGEKETGGNTKGYVPISELTVPSRGTVAEIAEHAIDICYRHFESRLRQATDLPQDLRLPPRRLVLFISYRLPHQDLAERLHALLSESHAVFKPYLDRHNLRGGEWEEQLLRAIRQADIFIPIVTADYGVAGMTKKELDEARVTAEQRSLHDFIHPVLLPDRTGDVGENLQKLQGLSISGIGDLIEGKKWDDFTRRLLDAWIRPASQS